MIVPWHVLNMYSGRVTPLVLRSFFFPPLLLYPTNSSFLPSFPFIFPFVEFTGSRSPAPLPPPREQQRDLWDGKREARDHDYHHEGDARHSERERSRQHEGSHGPKSVQDHARERERPIDSEVNPPTRTNLGRERVLEGDACHARRDINVGTVGDQRSQDDTKSKRNPEDYDRRPEELARKFPHCSVPHVLIIL